MHNLHIKTFLKDAFVTEKIVLENKLSEICMRVIFSAETGRVFFVISELF